MANFDFAALAANPRGGFGPSLECLWRLVWDSAKARAAASGLPARPIASLERRQLETIAAVMARELHRSIWLRTSGRAMAPPIQPDPDPTSAQVPHEL